MPPSRSGQRAGRALQGLRLDGHEYEQILQLTKQILIELDRETAERLERVAPARTRKALWELEEQATAEAYARSPDSAADACLDPAVWEPSPRRGRARPRGR